MDKITVIVVDDHPLFRQGVVDALTLESDLTILGDASNGDDALKLIRTSRPMVAILDVNLPGLNGQQVTRVIKEEKIPTKVILVTGYDDIEQVLHGMRAGASAYCAKDISPEDLVSVIRRVVDGKYVVYADVYDASAIALWLNKKRSSELPSYEDQEYTHPLSGREMEVLAYLTKGMSNKEIASALSISNQTIKNHVTAILRKLGVEDRTQAAVYALQRGWVRIDKKDPQSQE